MFPSSPYHLDSMIEIGSQSLGETCFLSIIDIVDGVQNSEVGACSEGPSVFLELGNLVSMLFYLVV